MKWLKIFIFIFSVSCVHKHTQVIPLKEQYLFPYGKYNQQVQGEVLAKEFQQKFQFDCLVNSQEQEFSLVGYGTFGFSLFSIKENVTGVIFQSSVDKINQNRDFFLKIFQLVKQIFHLAKTDKSIKSINVKDLSANIEFVQVNASQVPMAIKVFIKDQYEILIVTQKYLE